MSFSSTAVIKAKDIHAIHYSSLASDTAKGSACVNRRRCEQSPDGSSDRIHSGRYNAGL